MYLRSRPRTGTMVLPRCRWRVFACVFIPWFRPCPSMCVFLVSSCLSFHGFVHVYVCVPSSSSSYSHHGPAQVSFARLCVRFLSMVPSMSIHVCVSCVVVLVSPWLRPCLCLRTLPCGIVLNRTTGVGLLKAENTLLYFCFSE